MLRRITLTLGLHSDVTVQLIVRVQLSRAEAVMTAEDESGAIRCMICHQCNVCINTPFRRTMGLICLHSSKTFRVVLEVERRQNKFER